MITRISINNHKSFKNEAILETDKNIVLVYGLNGTGKSTISEYLRKREGEEYSDCRVDYNEADEEILVYNEHYVEDVFYNSESQPGIFSLSEENAEARKNIDIARKTINEQTKHIETTNVKIIGIQNDLIKEQGKIENITWGIKTKYSDNPSLGYCLNSLKGSKNHLFEYISKIRIEPTDSEIDIKRLEKDAMQLDVSEGSPLTPLDSFTYKLHTIEEDSIFPAILTGNSGSHVSELIEKLKNSDWVKAGMEFDSPDRCPFCQREYDMDFISELKKYFDDEYESSLSILRSFKNQYEIAVMNFKESNIPTYLILNDLNQKISEKRESLLNSLESNLSKILKKIEKPSESIKLTDTSQTINEYNSLISQANTQINEFNIKLQSIKSSKLKIKDLFWHRMRVDYANYLKSWKQTSNKLNQQLKQLQQELNETNSELNNTKLTIESEQKKIQNIDNSVNRINGMLMDMGITDFKIVAYDSENALYRIVRDDHDKSVFKSLSEGERIVISVLYFVESCMGMVDKKNSKSKKIIIIDDPISSLSNVFIFNIGRLLKSTFFPKIQKSDETISNFEHNIKYNVRNNFEQVFILTHNLYFFYEMTETDHDKRRLYQDLFRVSKNEKGSHIEKMGYESIQSEYQAYWSVIRDEDANPALIANCMRNVIEYFFNFVEKKDLNNVFNHPEFKESNKYQAFYRFINRESHSLGQNIYDFKDFNYNLFKEGFHQVFKANHYETHYQKMMKFKIVK